MDLWLRAPNGRIYEPLPSQIIFHEAEDKFRAYIGGVRAGKTLSGCAEGLLTALTHPGSKGLVGRWTHQTLTETTWEVLKQITPPELIAYLVESPQKTEMVVRCPDGGTSKILGWNLSKWEKIAGLELDWFHFDEVTEAEDDKAWKQLEARLSGTVGPRRGWGTGTPNGHDWVWKLFDNHGRGRKGYRYVQAPTDQNIHLPLGYEEGLRRGASKEWIERFLEAQFTIFEGMIFHQWDEKIHVIDRFPIPDHWPRFLGIDPGLADPCAALLAATDEAGNVYITDEYYREGQIISEQCTGILAMLGDVRIDWAVIDPVADTRTDETGKKRIDLYREHGILNLMAGNSRKDDSIALIRELLKVEPNRLNSVTGKLGSPRLFIFRNCGFLRDECATWRYNKHGKPMDKDDHAIAALRFLVMRRPHPAEAVHVRKQNPRWAAFFAQLKREAAGLHDPMPRIGAGVGGGLG